MGTHDDYVASIKSAFVTLGTKCAFTALVAEAPYLGLPIIRNVIQVIIEKILNVVVNEAETAAFFLYVDTRVNEQSSEFETAAYANRDAQTHGTKEQQDAAEQVLFEKFVAFASLTN